MSSSSTRSLPPVLGRLLSGTFWLALRVPLQVVFSLWTIRLVLEAIGADDSGAYRFAWGFGFFQFLVLVLGVKLGMKAGIDFFWVVAAQTAVQVGLGLGPALWVMVHELDHAPHFRGARWADYRALVHISFYMALIQISVVLADKF